MLMKEYRICMPLSVEEYRIGQLYMIAKHSHEQSDKGEGVEVVKNEPCEDPQHGKGQYTEKRIHLSSKLPLWVQSFVPNIFYITEKAWNYYPYTITEYTCSFIPKFSIHIETRYEDNNGSSDNVLGLDQEQLVDREVSFLDIATDPVPEHKYKKVEDPAKFKSEKTGRGPLTEGWRPLCFHCRNCDNEWKRVEPKLKDNEGETVKPIMCSYKLVRVKFEVWGMQTRVESYTHSVVRDILLLGHKQAFTWIDEWHGMTLEDIRNYETEMHSETNKKVGVTVYDSPASASPSTPTNTPTGNTPEDKDPAE